MLTDEIPGCAVCSSPMSSVGVLYNGVKVTRILACENGHFLSTLSLQNQSTWLELATMARFYAKLHEGNLLPSDQQELWIRKTDVWTRTKAADALPDDIELGFVNACPFCHSTNTLVIHDDKYYFLCCNSCNVYGPEATKLNNAIDKWNSA